MLRRSFFLWVGTTATNKKGSGGFGSNDRSTSSTPLHFPSQTRRGGNLKRARET